MPVYAGFTREEAIVGSRKGGEELFTLVALVRGVAVAVTVSESRGAMKV